MQRIKLLFALILLTLTAAKAQYETHLLSYTTLNMSTPDMDGDGDKDILTGGLANLQWQENRGNRNFLSHTITQSQAEVQAAIAVDLDKDGDVDVITASFKDDRIYWMENDGSMNFTENIISGGILGATSVSVIDLDNDGDSDIVCAAFTGDKISWLQNNGNQSFTLIDLLPSFDGPNTVVSCDFDSDGDVDLAVAAQLDSTVAWLENNGNEIFTKHLLDSSLASPRNLNLTDVDNDADIDLIYGASGGSGWFYNSTGVFTKYAISTGDNRDAFVVDLNNDTFKDFIFTNYTEDDLIWNVNNGNQTFAAGAYLDFSLDNVSMVGAADFDGDGFVDVIGASGFDVKVYWNSANFSFTKDRLNRYLSDANAACHGDFDGDGDIDIMAVGYFNINFYRNDSNDVFKTFPVFPSSVSFAGRQIKSADVDGDGDDDVVYTERSTNLVSWIENQGAGVFVKRFIASILDPYAVFPIDFDFDGDMDIVASKVQSAATCAVYWFENDGSENFTQHLVDASYRYPKDLFAVDYNKDGLMDVVAAYSGTSASNKIILHQNTGTSFFNISVDATANGAASVCAVDIDSDNDMDIVAANYSDNDIIWYENPGQIPHLINGNALGATHVHAADFDGDGDIDVASTSVNDDQINWYRNNGSEAFSKLTIASGIPDPEVILSGDIDGDGSIDLYSTCSSTESVALYHKSPAPPPLAISDCDDLFISEFIEGSTFNKAIEIYNPTSDTINLSHYTISVYTNGSSSATESAKLAGTILPKGVYLIAHPAAISGILNFADTTFGFSFNGNDAIALLKKGKAVDIIGKIGEDPGTAWSNSSVSTLNQTLVRTINTSKGSNTNLAFNPSTQWLSYPTDDTTHLGMHASLCSNYCPPSILISASTDTICPNLPITFTANVVNEGATPMYQWKKNGIDVGTNSLSYIDSTLSNNDIITCVMTSSASCIITPTITSNSIKVKVFPGLISSATITSNVTMFCSGVLSTFSVAGTNGGSTPHFQWKKNNLNVGSDSTQYSDSTLINMDVISCILTSNATCLLNSTANSNLITVMVNPIVTPSVSIVQADTAVCVNGSATFTALALHGGTSPIFQWKQNGSNITGANNSTYTLSGISSTALLSCEITSNATCISTPKAISDTVTISLLPAIVPTISITTAKDSVCANKTITFTANTQNVGPTPIYTWRRNNTIIGTNSPTLNYSFLTTNDTVTCRVIGSLPCGNSSVRSNSIKMYVSPYINVPTISQTLNTLTAATNTTVAYQWVDCNNGKLPIAGATNQTFVPSANGSYAVIVKNLSCSATCNCFNFVSVGIDTISAANDFTIMPNPSQGIFSLSFTNYSHKTIEVYDLLGKCIYKNKTDENNLNYKLNLSGYSRGLYFLYLYEKDKKYIQRIVLE